jgi:hypothetical protein
MLSCQQDRQYTYDVRLKHVRLTIVAVKKAIGIAYSECVSVFLPFYPSRKSQREFAEIYICKYIIYVYIYPISAIMRAVGSELVHEEKDR